MDFLFYLVQVNLYLILFYGFYRLVLFGETFHNLNRGYLVLSALLSFGIPLWYSEYVQSWFITQEISTAFYNLYDPSMILIRPAEGVTLTWGDILKGLYVAGISIFSIRLLITLLQLIMVLRNKNFEKFTAFSFFGYSFVDETLKKRDTILAHEHVHMQQLHSADVLIFEVMAIFNWFNPVVYLYKRDIKHIHEFIADEVASQKEISKADYAMLLFTQEFGLQPDQLANRFFTHSTLKRRIQMLNQPRSRKIMLMKYGLSVPLFILMLVLSSATIAKNDMLDIVELNIAGLKNNSIGFEQPDNFAFGKALELAEAENKVVTGKVTAAEDGIALPGVTIEVVNIERGTSTNQNGEFKINVADNNQLRFSFPGFETAIVQVGDKNVINIALKTKEVERIALEEVKVQAVKRTAWTNEEVIFETLQDSPKFPGGVKAMYEFIAGNLKYPVEAQRNNISGKVFVSFVVRQDGSISDMKILKGIGFGCDEETVRVISQMPKWIPGKQNGKPVNAMFTMPVNFIIEPQQAPKTGLYIPSKDPSLQLKINSIGFGSEPLFILDGKEIKKETFARIEPDKINEISVLKDQLAINSYGTRAKDGVVVIHTKGLAEVKK